MEHIILRKSDGVLVDNTFTWNNDVLEDAKEIKMGRVTIYVAGFKKHITVCSANLQEERVRYGSKIPQNVIRYLQPESIEQITIVTQEAQAGLTREDIKALNCVFFIDWSHDAKIDMTGGLPIEDGNSLNFILGQMNEGNYGVQLWGTSSGHVIGHIGLARCVYSTAAWSALRDNSYPNFQEPSECTLMFMVRSPDADVTNWRKLVLTHLFKVSVQSGLWKYMDSTGAWVNTSLIASLQTNYIVIIKRTANNFDWTIHNLDTGIDQTEQTGRGESTGIENYNIAYADAQTGLRWWRIGHTLLLPTVSDSAIGIAKTWMVEQFSGEQGSAEVTEDVFRLQDNQSNKVSTRSGRNFDLTFRAEDVAFIPDDFVVHLEVKH